MSAANLFARWLLGITFALSISGCTAVMVTGAVIGTVASVAVEVVELPFEVAGATYDLLTDDEDEGEGDEGG